MIGLGRNAGQYYWFTYQFKYNQSTFQMSVPRIQQVKTLKVNITTSLDVSPRGDYFSVVTRQMAKNSSMFDFRLELYDLQKFKRINSTDIYSSYSQVKHPCKILADAETIVVVTKIHIIFYNKSDLAVKFQMLHQQKNIYNLDSSADGRLVGLLGDNRILIWDSKSYKLIQELKSDEINPRGDASDLSNQLPINYFRFSYDNKWIGVSWPTKLMTMSYDIEKSKGVYLFLQGSQIETSAEYGLGTISSFDFNPHDSSELVIGFSNSSPRKINFNKPDEGFQKIYEKGEQPSYANNYKLVYYLPDGKRVVSSDYLEGLGLWPGDKQGTLVYKQNFLFLGLRYFQQGQKLIGFVWQQIKIVSITSICPSTKKYSQVCDCPSGQYWEASQYRCTPCALNGKNICECASNEQFVASYEKCVFNCSIPNALRYQVVLNNPPSCFCQVGYYWEGQQCKFDCSRVPFATGYIGSEECSCAGLLQWSPVTKSCVCGEYSYLTQFEDNSTNCQCYTNFTYSSSAKACLPNCTAFSNSTTFDLNNLRTCNCPAGEIFTSFSELNTAGCYIDCSLIKWAEDGIRTDNTCQCQDSTAWNPTSNICEVDCSQIINAFNVPKETVAASNSSNVTKACACANNYIWVPQILECGRNCTSKKFVNNSKYSTAKTCPCQQNFEWDDINFDCKIDCKQIPFTESYSINNDYSCVCRTLFYWNSTSYSCLINCSEIWDASKRVSDGKCACNGGKQFNSSAMICQSEASNKVFDKPWVWAVLAVLIVFSIVVIIVMVRFCFRFSTNDKNKEHNKRLKKNNKPPKHKSKKVEPQASTERMSLQKST